MKIRTALEFEKLTTADQNRFFNLWSNWKIVKLLETANQNSAIRILANDAGWVGTTPPLPEGLDENIYEWDEASYSFENTAISPGPAIPDVPVSSSRNDIILKGQLLSNESSTILLVNGENNNEYEVEDDQILIAEVSIIAQQEGNTNNAHFVRKIVVSNISGTVTQIGGVQQIGLDMGSNSGEPPSTWSVDLSISSGKIRVTFNNSSPVSSKIAISAFMKVQSGKFDS